jgi:hypothetical protein
MRGRRRGRFRSRCSPRPVISFNYHARLVNSSTHMRIAQLSQCRSQESSRGPHRRAGLGQASSASARVKGLSPTPALERRRQVRGCGSKWIALLHKVPGRVCSRHRDAAEPVETRGLIRVMVISACRGVILRARRGHHWIAIAQVTPWSCMGWFHSDALHEWRHA